MINLIASALIGSSLSHLLSPQLVNRLGLNFFNEGLLQNTPSLNPILAISKTTDLLDYLLTCFFTVLYFFSTKKIFNTSTSKHSHNFSYVNIIFSFVIFLQTHFVTTSTKSLVSLLLFYLLSAFLYTKTRNSSFDFKPTFLNASNGVFLGTAVFLLTRTLTTSVSIPIMSFVSFVFIYLNIRGLHFEPYNSRFYFLYSLLLALPQKTTYLACGLMGISFLIYFIKSKKYNQFVEKYLYPAFLIFIFSFNFRYYVGNFDSVEEGFWLAWIYRLANGEVLYKDVAVYHPPFLIWLSFLFQKVVGFSIGNTRLFFHLMQIVAMVIFYFVSEKIIKSTWLRFVLIILISAVTSTLVRNNVEIRLAVGLLSLIMLPTNLTLSGFIACVSLFTSLEVGLTSIAISLLATKFSPKYIKGVLYCFIPFIILLYVQGALGAFFEQITFYARAFSLGYFNTPIDRSISMSHIHWHIFYQYLSSTPWFWEICRGSLLVGAVYYWSKNEFITTIISIFGLVIFRAALGRSDYYHLLFPFIVSLFVVFKLAEDYGVSKQLTIIFILLFLKTEVNSVLVENVLYRFQTYGSVPGDHKSMGGLRGGILVDKETLPEDKDKLYKYIKSNTNPKEYIFTYPWSPEIYFLVERSNPTSFDTPYAFYSEKYQKQVIEELQKKPPKIIIYGLSQNFGNLTANSLPFVNKYIEENYTKQVEFGTQLVLVKKQ